MVLCARETTTNAIVALKYLSSGFYQSPDFATRYRGEVSMLDLVEHPNIAHLYEFIERGGRAVVVTELVEGPTLRAVIEQTGPLDGPAALYTYAGALQGLAEAHRRGILHRGVKPENFMIDASGLVKVVDIGLTPAGDSHGPANAVYAAPELWRGAPASRSADVYAASAMLFELLSGHPPVGTGGAWLGRSGQPAEAATSALPATVAADVRGYLAGALATSPELRPADADDALQLVELAAMGAFGPTWYDLGRAQLVQRLASVRLPELQPLPPEPASTRPPTGYGPPAATDFAQSSPATYAPPGPATYAAAGQPHYAAELAPAGAARHAPQAPAAVWPPTEAPPAWAPAAPSPAMPVSPAVPAPRPRTPDRFFDEATAPVTGGAPASVSAPPAPPRRGGLTRMTWVLVVVGVLVLGAGGAFAVTTAFDGAPESPAAVTTNSHQPMAMPGPTVPPRTNVTGADKVKPAAPAGLRVIGRSITGVSITWNDATDNVKVAGYIVLRNGAQVGTSFDPGFTDTGLMPNTRYLYAVAAFDEAGNISASSKAVSATTLVEPDVAPPTVPSGLHSTGQGQTSIVLAWSASQDNIGVAGYEVFRNGALVANVASPGYTDVGLTPATMYSYKIRAFDTSNNASGDSATIGVKTLATPDTSPPTVPGGLSAVASGPNAVQVSWSASTDNVGVTFYRLFRDGVKIADVPVPGLAYADEGLNPSTTYEYTIRAYDGSANQSPTSAGVSVKTDPAPTTPPPTDDPTPTTNPVPYIMDVGLAPLIDAGCVVGLQVTVQASAPMSTTLTYDFTGSPGSGSLDLVFDNGGNGLMQTFTLPGTPDGHTAGTASVFVGGQDDHTAWADCDPDPTETEPIDPESNTEPAQP